MPLKRLAISVLVLLVGGYIALFGAVAIAMH
jgi:hypothetical protein